MHHSYHKTTKAMLLYLNTLTQRYTLIPKHERHIATLKDTPPTLPFNKTVI